MACRISTSLPICSLQGTINYISGKFNVGLPDIFFYNMVRDFASYISDSLDDILPNESRLSICKELEVAAAEEILAFYGYRVVSPYLVGQERANIEEFFNDTAKDELDDHFVKLLNRMNELQYIPTRIFDFANIQSTAVCEYHTPENVSELIPILEQNIESEECAIRHYQRIIDLSRDLGDYTTERLVKEIQADEYDHLSGLHDFLSDLRS